MTYKVTVIYKGRDTFEVEADNPEMAELKAKKKAWRDLGGLKVELLDVEPA